MDMAQTLIKSMSEKWNPAAYKDEYTSALEKVIAQKVKAGGKSLPTVKASAKPVKVINLMDALKQSLAGSGKTKKAAPAAKAKPRKKAG